VQVVLQAVRAARRSRAVAALAFLLAVAYPACGASEGDADEPERALATPQTEAMTSATPDSLRLRIDAPDSVRAGDPMTITLVVENVSGRALELYLRGRTIAFDLIVRAGDGSVVWRRLEDEIVPAILRLEPLGPDATLALEGQWDQRSNARTRVPPGEYSIIGELFTEGEPLQTPPRPLRILP